ncbi:hypothetical protein KVE07_03745 [Helicobacter pylori]|nr:hypothetical protein KVE07_03745 [Helicobacter pylori]
MKKVVVSLCVALGFLSADPVQANKAISNEDKKESGDEKSRCEFMRGVRFFKCGSSASQ